MATIVMNLLPSCRADSDQRPRQSMATSGLNSQSELRASVSRQGRRNRPGQERPAGAFARDLVEC